MKARKDMSTELLNKKIYILIERMKAAHRFSMNSIYGVVKIP